MIPKTILRSVLSFIMLIGLSIGMKGEETLQVSLITCWPGAEVYELYGHTAVRISGTEADGTLFDSVWNYGMFNYSEPNFVGRFVKGEMMYRVGGYPFGWFMPEYVNSGRRVEEQVLSLSPQQASELRKALQINSLPQNRTYLYDYVKDNCSTRVWDKIEEAAPGVKLSKKQVYATYREAMRAYHNHYPWYSLGIDVALAYPVDTLITDRDQIFLPIVLHDKLADATMADGHPVVNETRILNAGIPDATLSPTPWYASPLFFGWVFFAVAVLYCYMAWYKRRNFNWLEALFFGIVGVVGCVVAFLVFVSIHRAASPNLLVVVVNPLALIVPILIWSHRTRPVVVAYMVAQTVALLSLTAIWPFQTQCGNPVFIPLALTDLLLSVTYAVIYFKNRRK